MYMYVSVGRKIPCWLHFCCTEALVNIMIGSHDCGLNKYFLRLGAKSGGRQSTEASSRVAVGGSGRNGTAVRHPGSSDVVGILVGHHGARHIFRDVRYEHGHVRVLRLDEAGSKLLHLLYECSRGLPLCSESYVNVFLPLQDYNFPEVRNREYLISLHRYFEKNKFDFDEYNKLKDAIAEKEQDLMRLRDPLQLQLPIEQLLKKAHAQEPDYAKDS